MNRRWPSGRAARVWGGLALLLAVLGGIGAVFGLRLADIAATSREVQRLRQEQNRLWREIEGLRGEIREASTPAAIERMAREVLRWGYPDEEIVILLRRR